jgi:hypothetical protein
MKRWVGYALVGMFTGCMVIPHAVSDGIPPALAILLWIVVFALVLLLYWVVALLRL